MEFERNQGKLEETVIQILKSADLEIATELVVRREAERLLGVDLSDIASKRLVRRVVESFLLSTSPADEVRQGTEQVDKSPTDNNRNVVSDEGGGRVIFKLPGMMRVSLQKFKKTKLLSIREYYQKEQLMFPSGTGITLNPKEWSAFCSSFNDIEEAITKMESRTRSEGIGKKQTEAEVSNPPHPLIPIATTRFTGRNYYCWKRQMEFFLNQLRVSYVLFEPCPKIPFSPPASLKDISQAKSYLQQWTNDDYLCRHTILNSLSDHLFDQYSIKTSLNAREIWEEIKSCYDDDFGTKRSHVNNYIQFQMIDGVSVVEQVEELHRIAGTITASGIHIDENFHISVIISKLPASWKNVRAKLMQEEHLPLDKLIFRLKDEEDSRSQQQRWKRKEKDMRGVCFGCHKEGHIRRDCPLNRRGQNH
ncbi:hypothetical protein LXL04_026640 [Taraxacum kok-saghyz]